LERIDGCFSSKNNGNTTCLYYCGHLGVKSHTRVGSRDMNEVVRVKRLEISNQREERLVNLMTQIVTQPAILYVALVLLLEYLSTHPEDNFELFGAGGGGYISKDTAKVVTGGLTAALAANALGGGAGISSIITSLKK